MALSGVAIRRASKADLTALVKLTKNIAQPEADDGRRRQWQERLLAPEVFTYLAEDEQIFGFVSVGPSELLDETDGEVIAIFLAPDYRGLGMGKKLLVRGLSVLKRRNFNRAVVFVNGEDSPLKELLAALGFQSGIGNRELNHSGGTLHQEGYALMLDDYF